MIGIGLGLVALGIVFVSLESVWTALVLFGLAGVLLSHA
jgi:hypothetical protein